jgi:hypothetical protein
MQARSSMLARGPRASFSGSVASSSGAFGKRMALPEFECAAAAAGPLAQEHAGALLVARAQPAPDGRLAAAARPAPTPACCPCCRRRFNLGNAKAAQVKKHSDSAPASFRRLLGSPLFDALLNKLILYFVAAFQYESLSK